MKSFIHRIGTLLMVVVVLISTMSFSVLQHYCGTELVDQSIFADLEPCCMDSEEAGDQKDACCSEQQQVVQGQDELAPTFADFDLRQQVFLTSSLFYSYTNLFEGLSEQVVPYIDYSPPLLITDIHLVDQVFII